VKGKHHQIDEGSNQWSCHQHKTAGFPYNNEYFWTQSSHPEIMNPVRTKINKDQHIEWLSYKNITNWAVRTKEFLIAFEIKRMT